MAEMPSGQFWLFDRQLIQENYQSSGRIWMAGLIMVYSQWLTHCLSFWVWSRGPSFPYKTIHLVYGTLVTQVPPLIFSFISSPVLFCHIDWLSTTFNVCSTNSKCLNPCLNTQIIRLVCLLLVFWLPKTLVLFINLWAPILFFPPLFIHHKQNGVLNFLSWQQEVVYVNFWTRCETGC